MIRDGSYRLIGLKDSDITAEFDNLINSALEFLIIVGYSFTKPSNYKSVLSKIINAPAPVKHCILPIDLYGGRDKNRTIALELINRGVSVSIEPVNHSKWLMNEEEIYFGSANFTCFSIEKRIEVVTFKKFNKNDTLKKDFTDFVLSSMKRMTNKSTRSKIRSVITKNQRLIDSNKKLIKRYNPSIQRVTSTLDSIGKVQSAINELLVNSYWYLENDLYYKLTSQALYFSGILRKIDRLGNEIIQQYKKQKDFQRSKEQYNELCDHLVIKLDSIYLTANDYIQSINMIPDFTKVNRKLLKNNSKAIVEIKETKK